MRIVHQKNDKSLTLSFKLSCSGGGVPLTPPDARGLAVVDSTGKKLGIRNVQVTPELSYENDFLPFAGGKSGAEHPDEFPSQCSSRVDTDFREYFHPHGP